MKNFLKRLGLSLLLAIAMGAFAFPASWFIDYYLRLGVEQNPQAVYVGEGDTLEVTGGGQISFVMFASNANKETELLKSGGVVATTLPTLDPSAWQTEGVFTAGSYYISGPGVTVSVSAPAHLKRNDDPNYRRTFASAMSFGTFVYALITALFFFFVIQPLQEREHESQSIYGDPNA